MAVFRVKRILTRKTGGLVKALSVHSLGCLALERRGQRGIREVATEVGVSPATLSRVERGKMPDLETFGKICKWLRVDPASVLGIPTGRSESPGLSVHFRKDQAIAPETAKALAQMILAAQRAVMQLEKDGE
jgi:transcriptional regulator with XRE-family HTH domain